MNRTIIESVAHNATNITIHIENQLATASIDPNWFYSAVAQSSAAIVGLMGAFLTTKLINQKIIINQLHDEIENYKLKIKQINDVFNTKSTVGCSQKLIITNQKQKEIDIDYYNQLIKDKTNQLNNNQDFEYLKLNYAYLGLFSVLGVFLPLATMLFGYDDMLSLRPFIFFFMSVGWIFILWSIGSEINKLFHSSKTK